MLKLECLELKVMAASMFVSEVMDYSPGGGVASPYDNPENAFGGEEYDEGRPGSYVSLGEGGSIAFVISPPIPTVEGLGRITIHESGVADRAEVFLTTNGGEDWHSCGRARGSWAIRFVPDLALNCPTVPQGYIDGIMLVDDDSADNYTNAHAGYDVDFIRFSTPLTQPGPMAGDANLDGRFDQADIGQVVLANKYGTEKPAEWSEGDWNGDGVFNQLDLVEALALDRYLR